MSDELKDILSQSDQPPRPEDVLKYLKQELDDAQAHELEKTLQEDRFTAEALEGLEQIRDPRQISIIVDGLNRDLRKRTAANKKKRAARMLKPQWVLYFSILIFLILILLVYLVLHQGMTS